MSLIGHLDWSSLFSFYNIFVMAIRADITQIVN